MIFIISTALASAQTFGSLSAARFQTGNSRWGPPMAKGTDYGDDLNALLRASAGKEWRRLLATEDDSEQQRSARKKDLLRLLHVSVGYKQALARRSPHLRAGLALLCAALLCAAIASSLSGAANVRRLGCAGQEITHCRWAQRCCCCCSFCCDSGQHACWPPPAGATPHHAASRQRLAPDDPQHRCSQTPPLAGAAAASLGRGRHGAATGDFKCREGASSASCLASCAAPASCICTCANLSCRPEACPPGERCGGRRRLLHSCRQAHAVRPRPGHTALVNVATSADQQR